MRPLEVLFDYSLASDESAGPRTVMAGLLRGWAEAHQQDRVTVFGPATLSPEVSDLGFQLVVARAPIPPRRIVQQQLELPIRGLGRAADVVVVPNLACSLAPVGAPVLGTLCDLRHLRRPHEFSAVSRLFRAFVWTQSARRMSAVVSISEFSLREADELRVSLPKLRTVAPLGVDHVRPLDVLTKRDSVVCVGHRASKGLDVLPALWAAVQRELGPTRPELLITGVPSDLRETLVRSMVAAGVDDGYGIAGFLPTPVVQRSIAEAKAVLYLSPYEGYGFVPSEATVLGTHSFVYDLPPYRERASQLSATRLPVGDWAGVARALCNYLRAGLFSVPSTSAPTWADTAMSYRELAMSLLAARGKPLSHASGA